jgi:hypothetical protein
VHLVAAELHAELQALGYADIGPGTLGENVTTAGSTSPASRAAPGSGSDPTPWWR